MLNRLKTVAKGEGTPDTSDRWNRRGSRTPAEVDQFRVQQQAFYVRGDLVVDVHQARGIRSGSAGERNTYCIVLVDGERVGETPLCAKTQAPMWNQPITVPHETIRQAADRNVWPVPYQPLIVQVWDRANTSDTLLGSARVMISESLSQDSNDGWYRLVGSGDQGGSSHNGGGNGGNGESAGGKICVRTHWHSKKFSAVQHKDQGRFFMRDVFGPGEKDYQHLYYGGLSSFFLAPPPGEEMVLEMMTGICRHDPLSADYGKGVDGMLVLTELRLLFMPDIRGGTSTISFLEFHTVQVYLAAVRSFSHRGLEGGSRLLSITVRDGRAVHFRMPASAAVARCGEWYEIESARRRHRLSVAARSGVAGVVSGVGTPAVAEPVGEGGAEELWSRGLSGACTSELWMERLADEIRWRKAQGDFVSLWFKLVRTSRTPAPASILRPTAHGATSGSGTLSAVGGSYNNQASSLPAAKTGKAKRGDEADGWAALERDLERVGVPPAGPVAMHSAFGRQMWEFKKVNHAYAMIPTYPQTLAFPSSITPAQLAAAAPQRSRCRLPALVWLHPSSKAPLVRSSQPMAGMTTKVLSDDIHLLKQIRVTLDATKISIVDARSLLNAKANQVTGKGYEDVADIGRDVATLGFMGIDNIHAVRDSLAAFSAASQSQGQEYFHAVGASGWLRHLAQIMKGAAFVADELQRGVAVLVHCSDGWDRTSQLTGLAQLILDPYYRTLEGFELLVEKEWCSFGHMFGLRAHSDSPTESSPVFLQWLDAVWQLVRQYPSSFEFTGHYLERLVEALYSAAFLTFAGNCERERKERLKELQEAGGGGVSIFTYLRDYASEGHLASPLVNPLYRPRVTEEAGAGTPPPRVVDVLRPCCEAQGLEIWRAVYMRDNLLLHHREQQLSVEQGLRLQVYDYERRIRLLEEHMRTLPRGLARQLADSAVGMNGPEWDDYERVVTQAKTDKTARAARAAVIANTVALRAQTRGRSLQRSSGGGTGVTSDTGRSRSNPPDESSRSRSRSFNLPLRGWGTGERRKRWLSRDSAPDVVECETSRDGSGRLSVSSGTDTISGGGGGGGSVADNLEDGDGERTGRTRSFFGLGGKFGGRRRASSSAVTEGDGGGLQMVSEGTARKDGGGNTGKKKHTRLFGGGGDRRRALSTAGSIRSADRGAGMSRLRMFSSSSQTNIPSSDHSPPEPTAGMVPSDSAADAPSSTVMSHVERRRPDTFKRCSSFPGEEGLSSPESATGATAAAGRSRVVSAAAVSTNTRAANKYSGGQVSSLQQRRRRTLSTEAAELEEIRESTVTPTASERGSSVFYTPSTTSKVNSRWNITRRRSTGSTDGDPGVSTKKKGVLRSLQRTLGTGSGSRKSSKSVTVVIQGRAPRGQPSSGNVNAGAVGENGVTDERGSAATAESRLLAPVEPEVSQAELQRRREAEEKAVRAELLRKIVCLEMQMLVKEIVDLACVEAEKASLLRLEVKPTPTSSTDPIAHPPVSRSSPTPERPNFFGVLWGVDQWQRQRRHTAAVEDKWKASTIEESMERSRELSMPVQSRPAVARGTGPVSAWDDTPRGGGGGRGGGQGEDEAKRSDSGEQKVDDDGGFFAALRRKLFEGQDVVSTSNSSSMERKLPSPSPASFQDEESKTSLAASPVNRRGKQMTWATPESGDGGRVAVEVGAGSGAGSGPAETRFMPLRPGPKARAFGSDGVGGGSPSVGPPSARIPGGNVAGAVAMGVATNPAEKRQHRVVSAAVVPGAASGAVNRRRHNTTAGIAAPPPRPRQHSASSNYSRGHRQGLGAAAIAAGTAAAAADTGSSQSSGAAQTRQLSGGHIEGARAAYPADAGAGGDRPAAVPVSTDGFHGHSSATGFVPPRGRGRNSGGDMDGSARGVGARREVSPEVAEDMAARFGLVRMVFGDQNN